MTAKTVWKKFPIGQDIMRIGNFEIPSRALWAALTLKALTKGKTPLANWSGGERGRLHLAKTSPGRR